MNSALNTILRINYPEVFRGSEKQPSLVFSHDSGWYSIVDSLCMSFVSPSRQKYTSYQYIKSFLGQRRYPGGKIITHEDIDGAYHEWEKADKSIARVWEMKEKFGILRVACEVSSPSDYNLIQMAETLSSQTCEICGLSGPQVMTYPISWHKTLCPVHADLKYGKEAIDYRQDNAKFKDLS